MTYSRSRLISNRVVTTTPGNVTLDRYQYLDLSSAEPNLGISSDGNILTTNTAGARIWTNNITVSTLTVNSNLTAISANISSIGLQGNTITGNVNGLSLPGNIYVGNIFYANGSPFVSSNYGNVQMLANLAANTVTNIAILGNITANYILGNGSQLTGLPALYGNTQVAAYLPQYGGNISAANITMSTGLFWANGVSALYGNVQASSYLGSYTGNLYPGNVVSTFYGNVSTDYIKSNSSGVVSIAISTALGLPVGGNTARPASPATGQFRYNSDLSTVEFYNGSNWISLSNTITDQTIIPDGTNATYTLNSSTNAVGILVSINGTVQPPSTAYTVSGDQITFAEIPLTTDKIDIRFLAAATVVSNDVVNIDSGNIAVSGTVKTILDSFNTGVYRSVKYTISSTATADSHMAEVLVTQNNGVTAAVTVANANTNTNTITYSANLNGATVNLLGQGTTSSNVRIQRIYFNV